MDYDDYAESYAHTRWAVPWIVGPLIAEARRLQRDSTIVEIGCGTGNYVIALSEALPHYAYEGFDRSEEMLAVARQRCGQIAFASGDAEVRFPYSDEYCDLAFVVDVIHHIEKVDVFFQEVARVLKPGGKLLIVTDSADNIRNRSLTRYFPETLDVEFARYPSLERLHRAAGDAGLTLSGTQAAEGSTEFDDSFVAKLEEKCSSALRLISSEAHQEGMERVRHAQRKGETWFSCYTVLKYESLKYERPGPRRGSG